MDNDCYSVIVSEKAKKMLVSHAAFLAKVSPDAAERLVDDFQETEVAVFDSDKFPPYNKGFHTFNVEDGFIVVDGYQEKYSFFIKPLCVKMPSLMKKLGEKR